MTDIFRKWLEDVRDAEPEDEIEITVSPALMGDECTCDSCTGRRDAVA